MSNYQRIMYEDRCQIYALSKRGDSQESIAEVLGISQSAVSRGKGARNALVAGADQRLALRTGHQPEPRMHLPNDLAGQTRRRRLVAQSTGKNARPDPQ